MQTLLKLIDAIYEAVLDADRWPRMLEQATRYFDARGAQIGNTDLVNARLSFSLVHGYDWSMEHMLRYKRLMGEDPRLAYFSANPFRPVHCRMSLTDEQLRSARVYKEVLSVGGVEYSLGVNFTEGDRALSYFLVLRDAGMPAFNQHDCKKLAALIPHLARALRLQREMDTLAFEKQVGFGALDSMALGVLIADGHGRLHFANAMARRILDRRDGLAAAGDVLAGVTDDGVDLLHHLRAAIGVGDGPAEAGPRALRVKRAQGADPYLVVASTIAAPNVGPAWKARGERMAVLFVRDPDHAPETRAELLQRLYGLTGSEARLTDLVALGLPLKKGADALGITEATARQYLKQVFRKTGVHGQPDLVRKVMNLPPSIRFDTDALGKATASQR